MTGPRVFFHVQHLLGIGHLKRAATLCRAFVHAGFEVTLASGGPPVAGLIPEGVKLVQLPPMSAADVSFKTMLDENRQPITDAWRSNRAKELIDAWRAAQADVLLIELYPFGRRMLRFELAPLLDEAGDALVLCSVRDLLQRRPGREAETAAVVERRFRHVLVHGDPRIAPFKLSFGAAGRIAERIVYTGYVVDEPAPGGGEAGRGEVIVSAGGGAVGRRLVEAAIEARPLTRLRSRPWRILAGMNADYLDRLRPADGIVLERARNDFTMLLRNCELSISQAGYNTVMETLQARARAVLVPFAQGGETEQTVRARVLSERGLADFVDEEQLSAKTLAAAVDRAAARGKPDAIQVDLEGARKSAALIARWTA